MSRKKSFSMKSVFTRPLSVMFCRMIKANPDLEQQCSGILYTSLAEAE